MNTFTISCWTEKIRPDWICPICKKYKNTKAIQIEIKHTENQRIDWSLPRTQWACSLDCAEVAIIRSQ